MHIKMVKILIISVVTAMTVAFTACSGTVAESEAGTGAQMGVANPMQPYSTEEFVQETGVDIILPETVFTDLAVHKYNFEQPLYQFSFVYTDGNSYTWRMQKSDGMTDISGMYYSWTTQVEYEDVECIISTNDEGQGSCLWYDGEYTYSISMGENADINVLEDMHQTICGAMTAE